MPRDPKLEVSAINIRIPGDRDRNYKELVNLLASMKLGIKVHGNSYVAISKFNAENNLGVISKYDEIDIDGDWFDVEDFEAADDEKIDEIIIPENLRPNYSAFYFRLDEELHTIAFEKYSNSKSLSTGSVEKYFREALKRDEVFDLFGKVESDIIKSYDAIDQILDLPQIKELKLIIRRPNSDSVGGALAQVIEERLAEQNSDQYEETLKTNLKQEEGIVPNERTRALASIAAENGEVRAKSIVGGIMTPHNTNEKPLEEKTVYKKEDEEGLEIFKKLADKIFGVIRDARKSRNG
ncbi:MAG: DUF4747 family protein [Limimaricola soesokkakensis]|uniref:DUF4747 family protein n=1 Tax=Limimaricola soesokkakensis TaxID=1343159 RepID=UPI0040599FDF